MRIIFHSFLLISLVFINACTTCERDHKTDDDSVGIAYKFIENERYNFGFQLPTEWTAIDSSTNGDGYFIETGEKDVDIRIYGQPNIIDLFTDHCTSTEEFVFNDEIQGVICNIDKSEFYIYRNDTSIQIVLYVKTSEDWMNKNKAKIQFMAKSMVSIEE